MFLPILFLRFKPWRTSSVLFLASGIFYTRCLRKNQTIVRIRRVKEVDWWESLFFNFILKNIKRKKFRAWTKKCSVLKDEEPDTIDQQRFTKLQLLAREITTDWESIEKFALKRGDLIQAQMHAAQTRIEKEKAEIAELKKKYPCPFEICDCPLSNNVSTWPVAVWKQNLLLPFAINTHAFWKKYDIYWL